MFDQQNGTLNFGDSELIENLDIGNSDILNIDNINDEQEETPPSRLTYDEHDDSKEMDFGFEKKSESEYDSLSERESIEEADDAKPYIFLFSNVHLNTEMSVITEITSHREKESSYHQNNESSVHYSMTSQNNVSIQ